MNDISEYTQYEEEARERWGESDAYRQSQARTSRYTKADFEAAKKDQEAATELFVQAFGNGISPTSHQAQEAVRAHRAAISKWFYKCSIEMQKNLALLYITDPRFKEYYEGRLRGLAQYVHDAITAQRDEQSPTL
jgi:hypothetical protein